MSRFDSRKDYYSTLGAKPGASPREIERLFRRLAVRHHPDRGGDENEMKAITEAYSVLRDRVARRNYDRERRHSLGRPGAREKDGASNAGLSHGAKADAISGRFAGAAAFIFVGTTLLVLVRSQYLWFLWPLGVLASLVIVFGLLLIRVALRMMRRSQSRAPGLSIYQELAFWSFVVCAGYGIYVILSWE